jgi:hypothetical protein
MFFSNSNKNYFDKDILKFNFFLIFSKEKVFIMFNIVYSRNKFYEKKSDLKYFENQIFFYFLIKNFMLTKNALDVYFPSF